MPAAINNKRKIEGKWSADHALKIAVVCGRYSKKKSWKEAIIAAVNIHQRSKVFQIYGEGEHKSNKAWISYRDFLTRKNNP